MSYLKFTISKTKQKGGERMSATGRRAEIIRVMRERRKDTVANLAKEFGVNERTIRRDLLTLTVDEGYHIDTLQGNGGGVVFHGGHSPHKGILSKEQIKILKELTKIGNDYQTKVLNEILNAFA